MTTRSFDWRQRRPSDNLTFSSEAFAQLEIHPLISKILWTRGFRDIEVVRGFLYPADYHPTPSGMLPDIATGAAILWQAIKLRSPILIWGDFDVDGQTSTALLTDGLAQLGGVTSYYVPDRLTESHGIQLDRLKQLIENQQPGVLLTCDTGITAHDAIGFATQHGIKVVVTDHHDLPEDGVLPPANANINPKRLPPHHPLRGIPGVGVAYRLMQALYALAGNADKELAHLLDLVALGIVADVAEQTHDTRYLLQLGMEALRNTNRPGLQALFEVASIASEHLTTETIGFQLAPRLNAVGRLGDANQAVELLTTRDITKARMIAAQFDGLNRKRRILQRDTLSAARAILDANPHLMDFAAIVLYQAGWHPGLIGIVAGQLAEQYHRPCILLTSGTGEEMARGSARSAGNFDIGAAIAAQASMLITHGGHPGAAGLSLPIDAIDQFRRRLSNSLIAQGQGETQPILDYDIELSLNEVTDALAESLDILAPFGEGNPPVIFVARNLTLDDHSVIGRERLHRRLTVSSKDGTTRQILWWNGMEHHLPEGQFDLAFTIGWNTYQGRRSFALTVRDIHDVQAAPEAAPPPSQQFIDWRTLTPAEVNAEITRFETDYLIWAEGPHTDKAQPLQKNRFTLGDTRSLIIYTAPPSRAVLNDTLETANPENVYVVAVLPETDTPQSFLRRLQKLCNFTINHMDGIIDLQRMAGAMATTVYGVTLGLRYLATQNVITLTEDGPAITIAHANHEKPQDDSDDIRSALLTELQEIRSYRKAFRRMPLNLITDNT